jgi:hypothetical protein
LRCLPRASRSAICIAGKQKARRDFAEPVFPNYTPAPNMSTNFSISNKNSWQDQYLA